MIYAITVTVYPFPPGFDISRFVSFYSEFSRPDLTWDETVGLLKVSPDIISRLLELSLAKMGIPVHFFFFSVTWLTIFLFLLVFRLLHVHYRKKEPEMWMFVFVLMSVSVPAVLSGIRNIHALSVVSLALYLFFYRNRKTAAYLLIGYASLFHFSCYIFFLLPVVHRLKRNGVRNMIILSSLGFMTAALLPLSFYDKFLHPVITLKMDYYLINNSYLGNFLKKGMLNAFLYQLFLWYSLPLLLAVLYLKFRFRFLLRKEIYFLTVICLLFLFFPNIYSRYLMIWTVFAVYEALLNFNRKWSPAVLALVVLQFSLQHYFFWKTVYFQWTFF